MPTNDREPSSPSSVAGWKPARRKPSNSSNAAAATMTVTRTAVPARPMTNASSATAARMAPVPTRVGRSSPVGRMRDEALTCGASVSSSIVGYCDAAAPRRGARGDLAGGPGGGRAGGGVGGGAAGGRAPSRDLRRELLVLVDLGDVDQRTHCGRLVVE